MRKKRNPKKKIGISRSLLGGLLVAALIPLSAAPKKRPALDTYAIVSGSVFTSGGYALPDAEVILAPDAPPAGGSSGKAKPIEIASDARGEFVVRVPPGPLDYRVTVTARGYQSQQKSVRVENQERVEVTFQLERQSK